jgi:4-diphosphocytidyl-2C-methyl-D-erythritol kinase
VAFFYTGYDSALCTGYGEKVTPLSYHQLLHFSFPYVLCIYPEISVNTKQIYQELVRCR